MEQPKALYERRTYGVGYFYLNGWYTIDELKKYIEYDIERTKMLEKSMEHVD